ncbi:hypothetical protein [Serinicoccus sp. LYQ131]|uniref:hypothetical protein n=1 Tax=Serinicoccus sp. LYQ131 TaxID=3378797 RepID=UPI0038620A9D
MDQFLDYVSRMLERSDFLLPLAAAQRQFRADSYQMASAAQLEDLFHDALATYLREAHPNVDLVRRQGKELWDYGVGGTKFSHKESAKNPTFAVWWTAGTKTDKGYVPLKETSDYEYPVVFVLASPIGDLSLRPLDSDGNVSSTSSPMRLYKSLGAHAITSSTPVPDGRYDLVLLDNLEGRRFELQRTWTRGTWENLNFAETWIHLGGEGISTRDLWMVRHGLPHSDGELFGPDSTWGLEGNSLLPGIYVLEGAQLQQMPLTANNRAHLVRPDYVLQMLRKAEESGRYRPMPTWYAFFADMTPPNLYAQQRVQYERLFAPRVLMD